MAKKSLAWEMTKRGIIEEWYKYYYNEWKKNGITEKCQKVSRPSNDIAMIIMNTKCCMSEKWHS